CDVQVRAHGSVVACHAQVDRDADTMVFKPTEPLSGVAPGQAAVPYFPSPDELGDIVIGSGTIIETAWHEIDDGAWIRPGAWPRYCSCCGYYRRRAHRAVAPAATPHPQ